MGSTSLRIKYVSVEPLADMGMCALVSTEIQRYSAALLNFRLWIILNYIVYILLLRS